MGREIPLGRIAGIRVGMSWAVPVIAFLYVVNLAETELPLQSPGLGDGTYWLVGALGAGLFFASLLAHEVSHALVARAEGIGVHGISLWLLGGVTRMHHQAQTAGAELRIAGVGPLSSALVGVLFWLGHLAVGDGDGSIELLAYLLGWLAFLNLLLAAFNLLPGSPLDGGRVLTAVVWMATGSQRRGERTSARAGQVLGIGLLALGALMLSAGNGSGLWMLIVGMFILANASSELRPAPALDVLRDLRVGQLMVPDPPLLPDWMTVRDAMPIVERANGHRAFPVQAFDGRIVGLLTAGSLAAVAPASHDRLRVTQLAFPIDRVLLVSVDDAVLPVLQRLRGAPCDQALVLRADGRVAGVLGPDAAQRAMDPSGGPVTSPS